MLIVLSYSPIHDSSNLKLLLQLLSFVGYIMMRILIIYDFLVTGAFERKGACKGCGF